MLIRMLIQESPEILAAGERPRLSNAQQKEIYKIVNGTEYPKLATQKSRRLVINYTKKGTGETEDRHIRPYDPDADPPPKNPRSDEEKARRKTPFENGTLLVTLVDAPTQRATRQFKYAHINAIYLSNDDGDKLEQIYP